MAWEIHEDTWEIHEDRWHGKYMKIHGMGNTWLPVQFEGFNMQELVLPGLLVPQSSWFGLFSFRITLKLEEEERNIGWLSWRNCTEPSITASVKLYIFAAREASVKVCSSAKSVWLIYILHCSHGKS